MEQLVKQYMTDRGTNEGLLRAGGLLTISLLCGPSCDVWFGWRKEWETQSEPVHVYNQSTSVFWTLFEKCAKLLKRCQAPWTRPCSKGTWYGICRRHSWHGGFDNLTQRVWLGPGGESYRWAFSPTTGKMGQFLTHLTGELSQEHTLQERQHRQVRPWEPHRQNSFVFLSSAPSANT